tara:strand:+ start:819 stop:1190 length:372 start_codon:yes stop_codon:yes gene_type:complete
MRGSRRNDPLAFPRERGAHLCRASTSSQWALCPENEDHRMTVNIAAEPLRLLIERWERLEEEKKGISDDQKDVMLEAKATGYDPKIMRQIIRLRKMQPHERQEAEALLATYAAALNMQLGFDI